MPAWVSSAVRPAPRDRSVFVRFGGIMFWAGWFEWPGKWFALEPKGVRREIADPPLWWDREAPDQTLEEEQRLIFGQETTSPRPQRGARQLSLFPTADDSQTLSRARPGASKR